MKKAHHKLLPIGCAAVLIFTMLFGIATRISFGSSCYNTTLYPTAKLSYSSGITPEELKTLLPIEDSVLSLQEAPYVFIVNKISEEVANHSTKSVVKIKKVIKGNNISNGDKIVLYEYNYFSTYFMKGESLYYINNQVVNLMNQTDDYLVFLNKKNLMDIYLKSRLPEFSAFFDFNNDWPYCFMAPYFNLSKAQQTTFLDEHDAENMCYADIQNLEFICFSQENLNYFNEIKKMAVDNYLK